MTDDSGEEAASARRPAKDGPDAETRKAAAALAGRCERQVNRLARELTERRFTALPEYAALPEDMRTLEIADTARQGIRRFLREAAGRRTPDADLRVFTERAAQRAEEGLELSSLLETYFIAAEAVWDMLCDTALPGEEAALRLLARRQLRGLGQVVTAVTDAYQAEREAIRAEHRETLREIARALLTGEPVGRFGIAASASHLVLTVRTLESSSAEGGVRPLQGIAERRTLRRIRTRLENLVDGAVLMHRDERGGHILLPSTVRTSDLTEPLVGAAAGGERIIVGAARSADVADVPRTAARSARIARIADATGRPSGVYELDDVLLDYHLSGPADSAPLLAALLDPLADRPELVATVRAYLDHDMDRRRTARALAVHPNTVDNRLATAARLTGVDPRTARGLLRYAAALTLRQLG
ncbi:PucR family transcriptional regulator [Actinomadura gamaensis]|uniref:PucR family transcriptional regulator n=1 Tax=Actinomadura gamaensis TaxID=1763541 RepID=A0ABV9U381_9ACTN